MDTYEKKYKEALERARQFSEHPLLEDSGNIVEYIFPELKESENERIKKDLIGFFKDGEFLYHKKEEIVEWLEKQDEKPQGKTALEAINEEKVDNANKVEPKFRVGDTIINIHYRWDGKHRIREITDGKYIFDSGSYIDIKEQDSWELADNVEPKFKVGDWINGYYTNYKVLSVNNKGYVVEDVCGNKINILFENEKFHHLWTIQDAKDGDVLVVPPIKGSEHSEQIFIFKEIKDREYVKNAIEYYCRCVDNEFNTNERGFMGQSDDYFTPATKEQRELLFQKMKESGYMWDEEKKELKKIEQKPTGGEDDEKIRKALIKGFNECLVSSSHYPKNAMKCWHGIVIDDILNWLEKQGEPNLTKKQTTNAWKMIYRLMDNVKTLMDDKYTSSNSITNQDVDNIIDYIYHSLQNIIRNTIEREKT